MNKIFIHRKTGKRYELINDHFMVKELIVDPYSKPKYKWEKGYVLYKALYDCPDGPEFARKAEDFYSNFVEQ